MSKLMIRTAYAGEFSMNVLQFSAPMFGTMMSGQTKRAIAYFPIKAQQTELELDVIFASVADYMGFQAFVRATHLNALVNDLEPGVTLWWPQRNITNWTGVIRSFKGGGERFVYAPRARFTIDLVDSFVSKRTTVMSLSPGFDILYGTGLADSQIKMPDGVPSQPGTVPLPAPTPLPGSTPPPVTI